MENFKRILLGFLLIFVTVFVGAQQSKKPVLKAKLEQLIPFNPEKYVCFRTLDSIIIDGIIDDNEWKHAPWTNEFVDIEGDRKPQPTFRTSAKMLWDDNYLYIAAELEEPHIWANITERDAVMYHDNDFEVFIDPDGDTHNYYELEVNALNTVWDLMLTKPYRDGPFVIDSWDIQGLKSAVKVYGTLNNPSDIDDKWTIELALPWKVLKECNVGQRIPENGSQWRINFSRVEWQTEIINGKYVKIKGDDGKIIPENNWVWSPQGVIAMHIPETWGYVQFSNKTNEAFFEPKPDEEIKWALRQVYYRQKAYRNEYKIYSDNKFSLRLNEVNINGIPIEPTIVVYPTGFIASLASLSGIGILYIREDGKIWME